MNNKTEIIEKLRLLVDELENDSINDEQVIIDDSPNFDTMVRFMNDKRSPMSSSLSITFDSPEIRLV